MTYVNAGIVECRMLIFKTDQFWGCFMDNDRPGPTYVCPMHPDIRQPASGKCPKCGMDLLPEGTSFAMLRHMLSNPLHLVVMAAIMLALMAAAMMVMR